MEVGIILGQDAYELQRPLNYTIGTQSEPFVVLAELGWVVSGPMTGKRRQNVCHFAFTEDVKAESIQTWWDIETYASKSTSSVSQRRNCRHRRCWRVRRNSQASGRKWECCGVDQSQTYRTTTTAHPWVSFTHSSGDSKETQT